MYLSEKGYVLKRAKGHPRSRCGGYVFEHVLVAEAALGHHLPASAVVHHVDGDKTNNAPSNLVVCENQAYHNLLHRRQEAIAASGDASKVQCYYCREWDSVSEMRGRRNKGQYHHLACAAEWQREYRKTGIPAGNRFTRRGLTTP